MPRGEADSAVGHEHAHLESAPLAVHPAARGTTARASICIDPLRTRTAAASDEHIAIRPGTDAALALGDDARAVPRRSRRSSNISTQMTRRLGEAARARARRLRAGARRGDLPASRRDDRAPRHAATARRGRRSSASTTDCSVTPAAARRCARSRCCPPITGAWNDAGGGCQLSSSGTFALNTRRAGADRSRPTRARTINMTRLGEALTTIDDPPVKALDRLQLESRLRSRPIARTCCADCGARISSPSSSNISRPTPPTTPTCCCRRRRSSSTTICTRRTATLRDVQPPRDRAARRGAAEQRDLPAHRRGDASRSIPSCAKATKS